MSPRWRRVLKVVLINGLLILIVLGIVEALLAVLLGSPARVAALPDNLRDNIRVYYSNFDRGLVQYRPECARYDPELLYTLKPGECTFSNREFETVLSINSAGLRDDEASLDAPEVIALGDSLTMGWGVEQDESFSQVLERTSGLRVLNAGISSYGTVRELTMLQRLDAARLRFLLLQYARNDAEENLTRFDEGSLPQPSQERYEQARREHLAAHGYYPGKHLIHLLRIRRYSGALWRRVAGGEPPPPVPPQPEIERQALAFVEALRDADLPDVPILLMDLNGDAHNDTEFLDAVREAMMGDDRRLVTVDVSRVLSREHYYVLDDHLRAGGHAAVGRLLCETLAGLDPSLRCNEAGEEGVSPSPSN